MKSRALDYKNIQKALNKYIHTEVHNAMLVAGDSLELMR
jgi:hypothetical protein